ncbi:MAG: PEP-CTERM sorting domain-containing protein [Candidatus Omnitrophota bacterium]
MKSLTRLAFLFVVLLAVSGCNKDGMSSPQSIADNPTAVADSSGTMDGSGEQIAQVHNPEPTSMLLWATGLAGAALLRRKKRK